MARKAILAGVAALFLAAPASAGPGFLDPFFGNGGVAFPPGAPHGGDLANGVVDGSGRIVLVGSAPAAADPGNFDLYLVRLNPNGTPDTSFSGDGVFTHPFDLVADGSDGGMAVGLGPGGTIVAGGNAEASGTGEQLDLALLRLTSSGTPDTTFSGDGFLTVNRGAVDGLHGLVVDPSTGEIWGTGASDGVTTIFKLNANGTPASAFGTSGFVSLPLGGPTQDAGWRLSFEGDDIFVGGTVDNSSFFLARLNADSGALVSTFSPGGADGDGILIQLPPSGRTEFLRDLSRGPNGNIHAVGDSSPTLHGDPSFVWYEFSPAGGQVQRTAGPADTDGYGIHVQTDGKAVIGGSFFTGPATGLDFFTNRFNPDHATDPSWGANGFGTYPVGPGNALDFVNFLTPQGSDRLILGGTTFDGATPTPAVAAVQTGCKADLEVVSIEFSNRDSEPRQFLASGAQYFASVRVRNNGPDDVVIALDLLLAGQRVGSFFTSFPQPLAPGNPVTLPMMFTAPDSARTATYSAVVSIASPLPCTDPNPANNTLDRTVEVADPGRTQARVSKPVTQGRPGTLEATVRSGGGNRAAARAARVAKVQLAVVRLQGGVRAARATPACFWLKNARARFVRKDPVDGKCTGAVWLSMRKAGASKWIFRLKKGLPNGKYVVYTRASNGQGLFEDRIRAGKNRRAFTVRKR